MQIRKQARVAVAVRSTWTDWVLISISFAVVVAFTAKVAVGW